MTKQAKHTPGPWEAHPLEFQNWLKYGARVGPECGGSNIAHVYAAPETEANARLIAAAPDLLAACEALPLSKFGDDMADCDAADFKDNALAFFGAMRLARAAIAKARRPGE